MADDWKAWLELSLLVAVTLLALGRWVFGREHDGDELKRQRDRVHSLAADLSRLTLHVTALEERVRAVKERLARVEGRRTNGRSDR